MRIASERMLAGSLLGLILLSSGLLKLNHLGHRSLTGLDEVFHAIVARNLLAAPLRPMLYERAYLASEENDWQFATVWMHKPPMALWQIAVSFALLDQTPLALRLPSLVLSTGSVWLTYLIAASLFNRRVGLIAAALHAFNPATFTLVHGYIFSDHVDVSLLFWTELSLWLLIRADQKLSADESGAMAGRVGGLRLLMLAGAAQGLAFLSKTYPALLVTVMAVVIAGIRWRGGRGIRLGHVIVLMGASVITVAPWLIWCLVEFPGSFIAEHGLILRHLGSDVENWGAPWDRLLFDYLARGFHVLYPLLLSIVPLLVWRAWRERHAGLTIALAWFGAVVVTHLLATSKTPTGTLIGWPAGWVLLAIAIDRALRGDAALLGMWVGTALAQTIWAGSFPREGIGYAESGAFAAILRENAWIAWHALIGLGGAALLTIVQQSAQNAPRQTLRVAWAMIIAIAIASSAIPGFRYVRTAWRITEQNRNTPAMVEIGRYVRANLPPNAVMLVDETQKLEHKIVMFWTERSSYPLPVDRSAEPMISAVFRSGGVPFIVSPRPLPLPEVVRSDADARTLYRIDAP